MTTRNSLTTVPPKVQTASLITSASMSSAAVKRPFAESSPLSCSSHLWGRHGAERRFNRT